MQILHRIRIMRICLSISQLKKILSILHSTKRVWEDMTHRIDLDWQRNMGKSQIEKIERLLFQEFTNIPWS
jgi:hypothetical protein